jgi:hypothetical protein
MASGLLDKKHVLHSIKKAKGRLSQGVDEMVLGGAVYKFMDAVSRTILAHKEGGSVADVKGDDGVPLWSIGQAKLIEGGLTAMKGGAEPGPENKFAPSLFDSSYDPSKFSLDDTYIITPRNIWRILMKRISSGPANSAHWPL